MKTLVLRYINKLILQYIGIRIAEALDDGKHIDWILMRVRRGSGYGEKAYDEWAPSIPLSSVVRLMTNSPYIVEAKIRRFVGFMKVIDYDRCPWCGYAHNHELEDIEVEASGASHTADGIIEGGQGIATCPRCLEKFDYVW